MERSKEKSAAVFVPPGADWETLREASKGCRGCDLYRDATQTVFGEGGLRAHVMLVGEAPGDKEDKAGRPFVGPAGGLLDKALAEAGIVRSEVYITNAVKHFKFTETKHYRLHRNPSGLQIDACHPWLEAEISVIKPKIVVCLGSVAARSVLQRAAAVGKERGFIMPHPDFSILITSHPSAILRLRSVDGGASYSKEYRRFVSDLKEVRKFLARAKKMAA
jgi:uracil-DNA glycosylase family protein